MTSRLPWQQPQHLPRTRANRAILTYIPFSACLKYAARGSESNSGLKHNQHHIIKPSLQCFNRGPKEQLFCIFTFQKIHMGMKIIVLWSMVNYISFLSPTNAILLSTYLLILMQISLHYASDLMFKEQSSSDTKSLYIFLKQPFKHLREWVSIISLRNDSYLTFVINVSCPYCISLTLGRGCMTTIFFLAFLMVSGTMTYWPHTYN